MEERTESSTLDDAYFDRNQAVMLAACFACITGREVGWQENPEDPEWPILYVDLPTGQVSWHMPRSQRVLGPGALGEYPFKWDGHTVEEKRRRIAEYLAEWW